MKQIVFAGLALAAAAAMPGAATASMPVQTGLSVEPGIILVEGGCGPGHFRAENGYCYPRRPPPPPPPGYYGRPPPPPPPGYYGRACAPGFHPTPYGCRPNY